ncbi:hypothetical protein F511_18334 [Dorcoceras hygrometricum]|uniref:Uncharacterized protein n=1 Tax=Dorcoceras hygrometricum TaxID=472368 RepID=A0A2Z7C8I7_9LAMI|nr:hypothetical protein F511_18334 [Dorcoceras hygrometricum]
MTSLPPLHATTIFAHHCDQLATSNFSAASLLFFISFYNRYDDVTVAATSFFNRYDDVMVAATSFFN